MSSKKLGNAMSSSHSESDADALAKEFFGRAFGPFVESPKEHAGSFALSFNRPLLLSRQMEHYHALSRLREDQERKNMYTTAAVKSPSASLPVVELVKPNKVDISDIRAKGFESVCAGKFLLCRSLCPPAEMTSIHLVIEDPSGNCMRLFLYNCQASKKIAVGCAIALMNPWFKLNTDGLGGLRCDNPAHFILLPPDHSLVEGILWEGTLPFPSQVVALTLDNPGAKGSQCFRDGDFESALKFYTAAIEQDSSNSVMFANRALTFLAIGKPKLALLDAEKGLSIDPHNAKLIYRKAKSLLSMAKYKASVSFLETHANINSDVADLFSHAKIMLEESTTGKYDLLKMIEEGKKSPFLEHADYINPAVKMLPVDGTKGRGIVALKPIKAGSLIGACKAFAYVPKNKKALHVSINLDRRDVDFSNYGLLVSAVCEKLNADPSQADKLYSMYSGKEYDGFCAPYDKSSPVHLERIREVVRLNAFGGTPDLTEKPKLSEPDISSDGIWIFHSFLNHSCCDVNCFRVFIGDFMFLRASRDINVEEEIKMQYRMTDDPSETKSIERTFQFKCDCRLCKLAQTESKDSKDKLIKAECLLTELNQLFELGTFSGSSAIEKLEAALVDVETARPDFSLNFVRPRVLDALGDAYCAMGRTESVITCSEKCVDNLIACGRYKHALEAAKKLADFSESLMGRKKRVSTKILSQLKCLTERFLGDHRLLDNFLPEISDSFIPCNP